jgi:hypothetical protein
MDEIIALENQIRAAMPKAREKAPKGLAAAATAIMTRGWVAERDGDRLDALRRIVKQLEPYK